MSITMMTGDKAMKDLEARLKAKKVKGPEAIELLTNVMPLLRRRTAKLIELTAFLNEVAPEDRLYVTAWGIWRSKGTEGGKVTWVRANPPTFPAPAPAPTPPTVDRPRIVTNGDAGQAP
jgi:hypothetical protein